jgi:branched-chain amino acid transport system substrate-binding protein
MARTRHFSTFLSALVLAAVAALLLSPRPAAGAQPVRGVTDTEIVVGNMSDLSGVTAVQGVNFANALRMAFDDANAKGGVHGRKVHLIIEDNQYTVPRAVQAMNKLLNRDRVFIAVGDGGTPMNNAVMPMQLALNVPNVFPSTAARSMYQPFNRLKFGQFASYYDQLRAGVKWFVQNRGKKAVCAMYQDTDFGRDVYAGVEAETKALGMKVVAVTAHKPTDTDFTAAVGKLHDAGCDLIAMGTIVRDTVIIRQTARKMGWSVDMVGQYATYTTAVAGAPGNPAEGFYSMTPALYAYPDDPNPAVRAFTREYKRRYGIDVNFLGETGYTAAQFVLLALDRAGRNLSVDSFIAAMESIKDFHDLFGSPPMSLSPTNHHASDQSFLAVVRNGRWTLVTAQPVGY